MAHDEVNHPAHYTAYEGLEVIQLTEQMNFNRGNAVKYIWRFPRSMAEGRKASDLIRRALDTIDERGDDFHSGMRVGVTSAMEVVRNSKHGAIRFHNGQTISDMIVDELQEFLNKQM